MAYRSSLKEILQFDGSFRSWLEVILAVGARGISPGNEHKAQAEYSKALELAPDDPAAKLGLATAYLSNSVYGARQMTVSALARSPEDPELNLIMAEVMLAQNQFADAIPYLGKSLHAKPQMLPRVHALIGRELAQLPVFVRPGSILPQAPIVASTNETPRGPLTLRIYAGDQCAGDLYQDDGESYGFEHGAYLRMRFSCGITAEGMRVDIGAHQGSYPAWWKEIRVEVYGWTPKQSEIFINGQKVPAHMDRDPESIGFVIADDGKGVEVEVK